MKDFFNNSVTGDLRVNEQPVLGALHNVFHREHDRIAQSLQGINPQWNDETLFQEARRILNAQWQHIIYNEWLPIIIGGPQMENYGLQPLTTGYSDGYNENIDSRVTNEFAAAAFRFGHNLIPSIMKRVPAQPPLCSRASFSLRDVFNNADIVRSQNWIDEIIKGETVVASESLDNNFVSDVREHLFEGTTMALDLVAVNTQRGRDHGLPGYIHYRRTCGLGQVKTFEDLESNIPKSVRFF